MDAMCEIKYGKNMASEERLFENADKTMDGRTDGQIDTCLYCKLYEPNSLIGSCELKIKTGQTPCFWK